MPPAPILDEPQIVLTWLTRLRWLAVVGQVAAVAAAVVVLHVKLPVWSLGVLIAVTALTNLGLQAWLARDRYTSRRLVPAVVMFDVAMLTAVLALSGGPNNPFSTLYVVHVVIAVVLLDVRGTWSVVALSAAGFALLFAVHVPLETVARPLPKGVELAGAWVSLVLMASLIAYFVGRLYRELTAREAELASMRERAERSARFAAVTALAAGAAHELGSPLGTIAIVSKELELTAERGQAPQELVEDLKLIRTEVDRCRSILTQMRLEVSEDLGYQARIVTSAEFVEGAAADLTEDRKPRVKVEVGPGGDRFLLASRAILRAVGVLLRNGFEASGPDGPVTMRLRRGEGRLTIEVQDRGSGMPPEVLRRAGEPFFTTKEMGRGMGMGLFLVKLVIENNDGTLRLASTVGKGTLATIELPDRTPTPAIS